MKCIRKSNLACRKSYISFIQRNCASFILKEIGFVGWEFDGGKVEANTEANRLQIFFEDKPDEATREALKSNGFRWSPKAGAWQRQLTSNAYYAADYVKAIAPLTGEKPTELQPVSYTHLQFPGVGVKQAVDFLMVHRVYPLFLPFCDLYGFIYIVPVFSRRAALLIIGKAEIGRAHV